MILPHFYQVPNGPFVLPSQKHLIQGVVKGSNQRWREDKIHHHKAGLLISCELKTCHHPKPSFKHYRTIVSFIKRFKVDRAWHFYPFMFKLLSDVGNLCHLYQIFSYKNQYQTYHPPTHCPYDSEKMTIKALGTASSSSWKNS